MTMQQVHHLINGQAVPSARYFETINPATQDVLAEVAAGGEAEVNAAVAAAKAAFPKWAGLPAPQRARLIRKLGDLIAAADAIAGIADHTGRTEPDVIT